eukprot:TRINITY_DN519_c0_g1_i4.p1 TRINITY_DN519_c0_g1~~TRINITY_DN519_c0_g1_i4.p1  ORF type:complete len:364 (-),score=77.18 TRINITY_DN519_c0_g1_i4:301-1392(-)
MSSFDLQTTDSVKLFVGQVARDIDEEGLRPYFGSYGPIREIKVIRDKETRAHKGCAFVTFEKREDGLRALENLHDKVALPGATGTLQVKLSDAELEKQEHKLFISVFPKHFTEQDVRPFFEPFGNILEINVIRGPGDVSRGCAFLKYSKREEAMIAIRDCDGKLTLPGTVKPLQVKFAETAKQKTQRKMQRAVTQMPPMGASPFGYNPMNQMPFGGDMYKSSFPSYVPNFSQPLYGYASGYAGAGAPAAPSMTPTMGATSYMGGYNAGQKGPEGTSLFIYHLPNEFGDADLAGIFAHYGTIVSAKVYIDKATGLSKCFGFVTYDNTTSAEIAIRSMNGFQIGNKRLKVQHKRVDGASSGSQPY